MGGTRVRRFWHGTALEHESSIRLHGLRRNGPGVYLATTRAYALVYAATVPGGRFRGGDALLVCLELWPAALALRRDHTAPGYGAAGFIADLDVIAPDAIVALEHVAVPRSPAQTYADAFALECGHGVASAALRGTHRRWTVSVGASLPCRHGGGGSGEHPH